MVRKTLSTLHSLDHVLPSTVLTIFGATGDLALNRLLPTLIHMDSAKLLPGDFKVVAVGRRDLTKQQFLDLIKEKVPAYFAKRLTYYRGNFDELESFKGLAELLKDKDLSGKRHECFNRLYYFATSPQYFGPLAKMLQAGGMLIGCSEHKRTIRLLVEKPFGHDLNSAGALNKTLRKFFMEEQIYRIDHYLGKETVQNIMVTRFANDFLEPIWNFQFVDHVEISVLEELGVGKRAAYYDQVGALKDMVQNHMLQLLALTAMDRPRDLSTEAIRDEKVRVLRALQPFTKKSLAGSLVRGQYAGYREEVGKATSTETFVATKVFLDSARWQGVPFYLRTGKSLKEKITEISVHFKKQANALFPADARFPNILTFRIQPDERVRMQINNKVPGFGVDLHGGSLEFGYKMNFKQEIPGAYERLLLDFMQGDQRLFIRSDEIEAAWKFIDTISSNWDSKNAPLQKYNTKTEGLKAADELIKRDNRVWWTK